MVFDVVPEVAGPPVRMVLARVRFGMSCVRSERAGVVAASGRGGGGGTGGGGT
jgi:hypothetical protein